MGAASRTIHELAQVGSRWPDLVLGLLCLLLVLNAARRGFLREGSLLVGLGLALWLTGQIFHYTTPLLASPRSGPWALLVYVGLALVLTIVSIGASALAAPSLPSGLLRALDCVTGLALGLVEATLIVGLLANAGARVGALPLIPGASSAQATELASLSADWLARLVPTEVLTLARVE